MSTEDPQVGDEPVEERIEVWGDAEFDQVSKLASERGLLLSGTYRKNGEPAYFLVPPEADDEMVRDVAFAIREGRPLGENERRMIEMTRQHVPGFLEVNGVDAESRTVRVEPDPGRPARDPDDAVGMDDEVG